MKKYSIFFWVISVLLLTQSTVGDVNVLDTTKIGVSEGDSFSFFIERLRVEGDYFGDEDNPLPFEEGDTITTKVIDMTIESLDELPADFDWYDTEDLEHLVLMETTFANGSVEEEVSSLQQFGSLVIYTDWEYWTAQLEDQTDSEFQFGPDGEVTVTQDENTFTMELNSSTNFNNENGDGEVSEFYQMLRYEKSSGVFERIELKINNIFGGESLSLEYVVQIKSGGGNNLLEDLPGFELPLIGMMIFGLAILRRKRN